MSAVHDARLERSREAYAALAEWVAQVARAEALSTEVAYRFDLCLTEAVSNILQHGRPPGGGQSPIELRAWREGDELLATVQDDGPPFNPLEHPPPPSPRILEMADEGGFGLPILRALTERFSHTRIAGWNRLVLGFRSRPA